MIILDLQLAKKLSEIQQMALQTYKTSNVERRFFNVLIYLLTQQTLFAISREFLGNFWNKNPYQNIKQSLNNAYENIFIWGPL